MDTNTLTSPTAIYSKTITTAKTLEIGDVYRLPAHTKGLNLQANFTVGTTGTTVRAWVQTTIDKGVTWIDIANFYFTTAARKFTALSADAPFGTAAAPATALEAVLLTPLGNNLAVNGLLGDRIRTVVTTTGTYDASVLTVTATAIV